jgi:cob(I)alamin adenosyltransferase
MPIYTKKGDRGKTSLFSSDPSVKTRVSKTSSPIQVIGSLDEVNSFIGIVVADSKDPKLNLFLKNIQSDLFTINSILAGAKLAFPKSKTIRLEKKIDRLELTLPPLKNFILPGGSRVSANLQYTRALVRKAERKVVALNGKEKIPPEILRYLNRLSDLFFVLARQANRLHKIKEDVWRHRSK